MAHQNNLLLKRRRRGKGKNLRETAAQSASEEETSEEDEEEDRDEEEEEEAVAEAAGQRSSRAEAPISSLRAAAADLRDVSIRLSDSDSHAAARKHLTNSRRAAGPDPKSPASSRKKASFSRNPDVGARELEAGEAEGREKDTRRGNGVRRHTQRASVEDSMLPPTPTFGVSPSLQRNWLAKSPRRF